MADVKNESLDVSTLLSKPWQKFLAKFDEIESLRTSQWKEVHFLGYICARYKTLYGKSFALSYKGAPSKCPEMYLVRKMIAMLGTSNPHTIKAYIDWAFEKKIIPNGVRFKGIGFFTTPNFGNEFHLEREKKSKIEKTTELPEEYKQAATTLNLYVCTYGDLAFIKMALDQDPSSEARAPYRTLFHDLMALGFEPAVLKDLV